MPYTVALPDGRTVEFPDSVSREEAAAIIRRQLGVGAQPKESTIGSELVRGAKQLASTTRTGIGALATPEESARAGVERSQQIAAEAGEGPSFAALRKAYEERGLLPAAGELLSQIPRAVAGQGAQLAAMAGGAKLGAMAGTAVAPGVGTIAGGILGAGATLLPQFFGANVERQAAEQMGRGEPVDINRGTAAAAAAGQAGIEAAGTALVLGKRVVKGILGVTDDAALATAKAREELVKAAGRSRLGAAGRGAAVGVAEIPVEVAQAVIERAQAGLDVMSPEAFTEYGENAYLAGLVGPTIGAATRVTEPGAARRKLAVEEQAKAAEERAAAAKAEAEKKKTPEYLLGLDTRYKEAVAKVRELQAAVKKKPAKDADPAQWAEYNQKVAELKEFTANTMRPITAEYTPRKAEIAKVKDQRAAEVEAAAAQEIPQEAQQLPYYASAQETIPGLEPVEAAPAAAEETVDYAKQARDLKEYLVDLQTQAKTTTDLDAKLKLSTDYARAEAALKEATRLTKASGQEEGKAIDKLRKQMAVAEDQGDLEAQGRIAQQLKDLGVTDLGAQAELDLGKPQALKKLQVPTDMADYQAAQQRAAEEKAAREAQQRQQQQLAREAYERSQQTAGMYTDVLAAAQRRAADRAAAEAETKAETERTQREEELVGKLVESTGAVQPQPVPQARMALPARETTESLYDQAAELRAQLTFAQQTRNKNLESRVRQQLQQIGASPEEKGSALDLGATAREAGVEGELTPEAMEQNRLMRLGQRQLMSYDQLVKFITQAREREQAAVDEKTKAQYKYRAEQLKQAAIGFALQEINGRRRQYGLPELEHKDAMRAVTGLARPLNELVARGAQIFEEPVVVRGQQRGIRLVEGAQEFERPPAGKRTFSEAGFPAAADTLREQFRQVVETVSGKPQAAPPSPYAKPAGASRRVVPEQRELFLTPPPAEEPVSLAPEGFFAKGIDKAASADDARLLRQMQEVYPTLTPQQQSVVREQAQRAADGKPLDAVYEMRGLYQLRQREAATAAGQQTFLKPITLVTARRKIERLAQKAATLEKEAAEAKAVAERIAAGKKSEIERAQAAFDRAREQGKDLIATASQLRMEQTRERLDAANKIAELETKKRALDKEWDGTVAGEFAWLQARYAFLREEVAVGRAPKTNRAELAQLEKLYPGAIDRVVKISKALDKISRQIDAAKVAQQSVLERQAADTITNSVLKAATKAENKIATAQKKLSEARAAEKAAERMHKAAVSAEPRTPTPLEQIEAIPITGVTRVFRDTSDPAVQAQATKKRSAIAREEGTYAILEERLKTAEGDDKVNLQRQLNESEARLQKLHTELYDVYGNAPLKRVEGKTVEAAASAERLEKARHEVHSAEIDAFNAKHETARLSLPARKKGPMISERGVVKQGGERVIKAEPATPIADITSTRTRIDEINQQFAYIKENPAKSAEGKAKQAKVKTQLAAERQTLGAKLKELLQAQRQVSQEEKAVERELKGARTVSKRAIKQTKLEATDAQLFEDLADAKLSKEQRQLFERAQNAFGEMSAPGQAFVRRQANALVGRREADYKGEDLAGVVEAAERRMAREGEETVLPARGVEVESPDLDADQIKALENNDVAQALALLSTDKSADKVHRAVAQRLAQLLDATDVEVRDTLTDNEGNPVLGQALASGKKIRLSRAGGLTQEILLHEGTHAAAERVLEAPESSLTPLQLAAKRELQALHAAVKRDPSITSTDAKASLSEFVAEVMSNRNLQQQLAKKPWRLSDALQAFKSVVLRLLGVKDTQSMLGAAMKSVDAIFQPTSVQTFKAEGVRTQYSQKDIAALHDGSNSMRQFAENFPQYIKQKDRTPEDVDRIGGEYLLDMRRETPDYVASAEPNRLDYKSDTIMSDGTVFDPENPLHLVEATPTTFVALEAQKDESLRKSEAKEITKNRIDALHELLESVFGVDIYAKSVASGSYTLPEKALVAKAASKYGVQSTPAGRLKLVTIDANNRHPVAVVSKEAVDAIIEGLRAGKNLKTAFLDGMQSVADDNAKKNSAKNGWQKFEVVSGVENISRLYTQEEIGEAIGHTGYDGTEFADDDALVDQLISDGHLPDRSSLMQTATEVRSIEKAAIKLNAGAAGTSWCTGASVTTARDQIKRGDFYIYYKDGKPEVAVRMEGTNKIGEIRGNTPNQWLTPEQQKIAEAFLRTKTFDGSERFIEETERKAQLARVLTDKAEPGDSFIFADALNSDQTAFKDYGLDDLFRFRMLDGYASNLRPKPSDAIRKALYTKAIDVLVEDMGKGYIPFEIRMEADGTGFMKFGGQKVDNIQASEIIHAKTIMTPYTSKYKKEKDQDTPFVFSNLKSVGGFYLGGVRPVEMPKLQRVRRLVIVSDDANYNVKLSDKAIVDSVSAIAENTSINIKGGYYVNVKPVVHYATKFYVMKATVEAPYVSVTPYTPDFSSSAKADEAPPLPVINTPNKIGDAPPVKTAGPEAEERLLFARSLPTASRVANQIIGKQPTVLDSIKKSLFGLSFRTQVIDALAPLEQIAYTSMDPLKGAQMMYYLRKYGMRNNMTQEAIENGVAQVQEITRPDGQKERIIEAVQGANIKDIVKRLAAKDVIKEAGSADAANRLFTLYMSAIRGENKGFDKLNFGRAAALSELQKIERELASPRLEPQEKTQLNARKAYLEKNLDSMPTEADFRAAKAEIDANPTLKKAFDEAREMYNEYNTDLLNFLVQTGAISKDEAARLLRAKDYIPYYRMRGGNAELMIGGETPIRIGNLKDSPHLQELVGGEEPIFDFLTSSVQNTSMLLDMGLRNIAAKNVAYELADAGLASKPARAGKTGAPKGTLEFKLDGEDYFVRVDTDYIGVPSDLLVKGMAGIPTMLPQGLRLMGIPAQILRRAVTSTPVFAAKQLFRDSLGAYMLSGSDAPPLLSAVNQLRKASPLKARGVTGGQTFTGTTEDISRLLKEMQEGRPGWMKAFTKMEAMAHKADAATRQSQYESYRAQGLSDMEAELMALESMNFSKRGLSPTMHMASMLVPFLNAQIQGLDVLYKALTGNMPFNDKLDIQRKLFTRGASMFALTMAYAAAMQDDEEYKNAPPDVKYGNWFVRLPFLDEMAGEKVTLRVPIPFEVGYIFKALPEMLYNSMKSDRGAKEAFEALNHILIQIVPGGSSMVPIEIGGAKIPVPVPIPAAMKPVIEVGLGKSFFTGRDLESAREQQEVPGMRYRERTSEIAKYIGESVNFSPIRIEALVNGYTGGLGLLALQALSLPLPKADVVVPEKRWSELPLVGPMFQPADASNIIDGVYKDFQKVTQAKTTYDNLIVKGETGKAQAFLQENLQLIMMNQMAGEYRQMMGELTKNERIIRGSKLTEEEKRKLVDQIKAAKIQIAASVRAVLERKAPQAALA
jgi:hypothetical protein